MALGPLMVDLEGCELTAEERELLRHPLVGGVILFSRNYVSPEQVQRLVQGVHALRQPPLLVAVDHEGGRVQRFREGFTALPPARHFGVLWERDAQRARRLARGAGWLMAAELRAVGVDFSFAPVLDLDRGTSGVIGDRAYHAAPEAVAELAQGFASGMREAGMVAVGKHFPGHGGVREDSHAVLPVDRRPLADLYAEDILPFERMIHYGLEGVMPAHVCFEQVDGCPAGFSQRWLQQVLRGEIGFQGAIFSDDLSMGGAAAAGSLTDRAQLALAAGCDMVLLCNDRGGAARVLETLGAEPSPVSQLRLMRMHGRYGMPRASLREDPRWHEAVREIDRSQEHSTLDLDLR